jgi:hypothetical protein
LAADRLISTHERPTSPPREVSGWVSSCTR